MARINIEDSLFRDSRFLDLCMALGSKEMALGSLISAWIVGQEHYKKIHKDIPIEEWRKHRLKDEIIECGLAISNGSFVHCCGADSAFSWLKQKSEAGKEGGARKKPSRRKSNEIELIEANRSQSQLNEAKPLTLTLTPSLTLTQNHTPSKKPLAETTSVRRAFEESYFERYGIKPVWSIKENSLAKKLVTSIGKNESEKIAKAYPFFNDPWHIKQKHPFGLLVSQIDKVRVELANPERMLDEKRASRELSDYELKRNNLAALGLEE